MKPLRSWAVPAAAAVLVAAAVAVPVMLARSDTGPGSSNGAEKRAGQALALEALPTGAEPRSGYLTGTEFRRAAERVAFALEPGTEVTELVAMSGGFLLVVPDDLGDQQVQFFGRDGSTSRIWTADHDSFFPTVVVSGGGELGAFVQVGGKAVVVQDGGRTVTEFPAPEGASDVGFAPVAVSGTDCTGADADCTVLIHGLEYTGGDGARDVTWKIQPGGPAEPSQAGIGDVRAVASNGLSAGTVEIIDDGDGSCAGVADTEASVLWRTCKDRLISFSPGSKLVLASTSALFGSGDHELTILDSLTGEERLRLETAENVGIYEMVWEDDDHVLAVVSDWKEDAATGDHVDVRWAVLRIGVDGTREYAVAPVPGGADDYDGPLDLPQG